MGFFYEERFKYGRKSLSWMMILALAISLWPVYPSPVSAEPAKQITVPIRKELVQKRTDHSKLYDNGNGTLTKQIYFEPIFNKKEGQWKEISTDLASLGGKLKPSNTLLEIEFEEVAKQGKYATIRSGGHTLTYTFIGAEGTVDKSKQSNTTKPLMGNKIEGQKFNKIKESINSQAKVPSLPRGTSTNPVHEVSQNVKATYAKNEVTYKNVAPGVHLRNKIYNTKVKEDIVLDKYTGQNIFHFALDTDLQAKKQKDGSIVFQDSKGKAVFILNKPYMEDSKIDPKSDEPALSDQVEYEINQKNKQVILTVKADDSWLKDPKRVYPVYIDPSTSLDTSGDTHVSSRYPATNFGSSTELKIGYYDADTGTNYSYLKQDVSSLRNMIIDSATLNVHVFHSYYFAPTTTGLWLDVVNKDWNESDLTWNSQQSNGITSTNIGKLDVYRGQSVSFNVKSTVQAWANGTKPNYGFKFHNNGNGQTYWKKLSSSESSTNKPYLSVTYHVPKPSTPTGLAFANWAGSDNGFVDLRWTAVPGATKYYVWVFNGKDYQKFDVGNTTFWSTHNKGIWPTESEIATGRYLLHTDGKGTELALDPSPVYKNSGGPFPDGKNYWFRVSAVLPTFETPASDAFMPTITARTEDLGTEEFWAFNEVPGGDVNLVTGNLVITETDMELPGREPEMSIDRTYNSRSKATGPFGKGWTFNYGMKLQEDAKGNITVSDMDGGNHYFQKQTDGKFAAPLGIKLTLTGSKATGWTIKDKDQTVYSFDSEGKLTFIEDSNKNKLTLTYNDLNQLVKITDPSNRVFNLTYTNGKITQISGPDNRTWTYEYNFVDDLLLSVKDESNATTRYVYYEADGEIGKLAGIKEPDQSETWYGYNIQGQIYEVLDPEEELTSIEYDSVNKVTTFEDPNFSETLFYYNDSGNLVKEVEDPDGLGLVTTYTWDHNNLTRVCDPEANKNQTCATAPTESYQYDPNGNLTKAQDATGTETFKYNQNNDVTDYTDPNGQTFKTVYDANGNEISETDPDKVSEAQVTDSKGNVIQTTDEFGVGENLVINPGLERVVNGAPESWVTKTSSDSGTVTSDTSIKFSGSQSVKLTTKSTSTNLGYVAATQELYVAPNTTYTFSAKIKTKDVNEAGAFLNVLQLKADGSTSTGRWKDNRHSSLRGTQEWTQRQVTFTTASDTAKVRLYLEVDHTSLQGTGTAWFDEVQLEAGDVSTDYNPIENSSFEEGFAYWTKGFAAGTLDTTQSFDGSQSFKATRSASADTSTWIQYRQIIPLNQSTPEPITVTGLSKALNVVNSSTKEPNADYSIWVDAIQDNGDGTTTYVTDQAKFALGTHDWQRSAVTIHPTKKLKEVRVYALFRGSNAGTVWFDNIRVKKGSAVEKYEYDASGNNLTKVTDASGKSEEITYDSYGNETSIKDSKDQTTQYTYDQSNQLKTITLPGSKLKVSYTHDENGNVIEKKVTSGDGQTEYNTVKYEYIDDKLVSVTDELGNKTGYEYDGEGDVVETKNPNGSFVNHTNAEDGSYVGIHYNDTELYRIHYDEKGNEKQIDNVNLGTSKVHTFDASDRLVQQTQGTQTLKWTYDPNDQLTKQEIQLADKLITHHYAYNESENNIQVSDHTGKTYQFDYDEKGNVHTAVYANGVGISATYNDSNHVNEVVIGKKDGTPIAKYQYGYDANGNRISIKDKDGKELKYTYDELDQLTSETDPITGNIIHYTYDPVGNRTKKEVKDSTGNVISSTTYSYNAGNQLKQVGNTAYAYDKNGNRLEDGSYIYVWDAGDRLVEVKNKATGTTIATYDYDEDGRRVRSTINGKVTNYHYDGESIRVLYETDGTNQLTRYYTYNEDGQILSVTTAAGHTYYYQVNAHGDVVAVTDQDGNIVAEYTYDAWGNILKKSGSFADENPYRYAGYRYDNETKLYYLMARYYQPMEGVFLSADPDPGDEDDPQSQNVYTYASNNPHRYVDPDGHWINIAIGVVSGIYRGYKTYKKTGSLKKAAWAGAKTAVADAIPIGKVFKAVKYGAKAYKSYKASKYVKKYVKKTPKKATKKKYKKYHSYKKVKKSNQRRYGAGKKVKSTKKYTTKRKVSKKQSKYTSNRSKGSGKYKKPNGTRKVKKSQKQISRKQQNIKKAPRKNKTKREQVRQQKSQEKRQSCKVVIQPTMMGITESSTGGLHGFESRTVKTCSKDKLFTTKVGDESLKERLKEEMTEYIEELLLEQAEAVLGFRVELAFVEKLMNPPKLEDVDQTKFNYRFLKGLPRRYKNGNIGALDVLLSVVDEDGNESILEDRRGSNRLKSHSNLGNTELDTIPGWATKVEKLSDSDKPYLLDYMNDFDFTDIDGTVRSNGSLDRRNDSEFKLLEPLARKIMDQKKAGKKVKGTLVLFTERPMCPSCYTAYDSFKDLFKDDDIKVIVHSNKILSRGESNSEIMQLDKVEEEISRRRKK